MRQKKEERLLIEPTKDEVEQLEKAIHVIIQKIITQFRVSCVLSLEQAAEILGTTRKTLSAHEKGDKMYVTSFTQILSGFLLFMRYNKMEKNEELQKLIVKLQDLLTI